MVRRGRKSIVFEVSEAISAVNYIGVSKREARKKDESGIHSIKQVKETLSAAQNFVKWVRTEFLIKSIFHLNTTHYIAYLQYLSNADRSAGHRQNVETALKHLQKGMVILSNNRGLDPVMFVPEKRVTDWKELKKASDRSYSHEEYEAILSLLSHSVIISVKLMRFLGLRVRESCFIKVKHFIPLENGGYALSIPREEAKGVTKGGRHRFTPVPKRFEKELLSFIKNKGNEDRITDITPATVRKAVNAAFKKAGISQDSRGTHGFRHLYCRERLKELLEGEKILKKGKMLLARIMANRDANRKADYGILTNSDVENYKILKNCIDKIHEEIGHGKDRWDLAERYLREENEK